MASEPKPSTCDLCGKEADPVVEECWSVVCIAPHDTDVYHERCIQKFMRGMSGKNYDPSRRSGLPCPRGVGKGTQYTNKCPCKVSHCQKIVLKSSMRAPSAGTSQGAPAQVAGPKALPAKAPAPKPKPAVPKPAAKAPGQVSKPVKVPEHTWVPQRSGALEAPIPTVDPLGRNAAAAAAAAKKAAKKNAKRAAAKQQRREQGPTDGSMSDTSSMADSAAAASTPRWTGHAAGGVGGTGGGAGVDEEDWGAEHEDGGFGDVSGLDADQLLLLELLRQQRHKKPHELLAFTHSGTPCAPDSSSSSEEEEEEEVGQEELAPAPALLLQQQGMAAAGDQGGAQAASQQPALQQQALLPQQLPPLQQEHQPGVPPVASLLQQLAGSSISDPPHPSLPYHQHQQTQQQPYQQPYLQPAPQQQQQTQQQQYMEPGLGLPTSSQSSPSTVGYHHIAGGYQQHPQQVQQQPQHQQQQQLHAGAVGYASTSNGHVGSGYGGQGYSAPGLQAAAAAAVPAAAAAAAAAEGEEEDYSTDELMALLLGS